MLRRLAIRDFVIVSELELELDAGFTVLTGETGAGKSILVDALQLALGGRGDAGVVREGAGRAEIGAEFDAPAGLAGWLDDAGFDADDGRLLLRRTIDAQGKSRAWINGSAATVAQLREAAEHLVDIHGQHAWQSLTRGASVRGLLDAYAQIDTAALAAAWAAWRDANSALADARARYGDLERERERLAWQIGEVERLGPGADEWTELDAEHTRLANAQSLIDAARKAYQAIDEADESAEALTARALDALSDVAAFDPRLESAIGALQGAQAQLQDAAHTLAGYLHAIELDPDRLQALDERLSAWLALARRYRRPPAELAGLLAEWQAELRKLDEASDLDGLQQRLDRAAAAYEAEAARVSQARRRAAPALARSVTQSMQQLGMTGGRFEVELVAGDSPQSYGAESAEFLVAGHAGSTPRPLAKVASGGELSRIALAIAVTTSQLADRHDAAATLIFDEVDAGVGGAVAETVGRMMKQLGRERQVLAVTHLPQVAACADHHAVVAKRVVDGRARSEIGFVTGETRVAEIARMLGGERLSGTSLAHAQEMLAVGSGAADPPAAPSKPASRATRRT
ncbi:DNA repair protein RecN [Piscinibacter koreensis]|uniref:DNA repair protein RecN n=1 Tax=Piscinibacter koreensis TaxID=2742824 RepID=A0A7Y6NNZ7_9BURK|nr:DNA repair protein RecN [Schlegelella koreensis]NUZ06675.1 DNA repair protein RecN [Schlegelella koreensis]